MARSRIAAALAAAVALGACQTPSTPAAVVIAPAPKVYTCEQQRAAAREYDALPIGAALRIFVNDYGAERRQLRAARGEPELSACQ